MLELGAFVCLLVLPLAFIYFAVGAMDALTRGGLFKTPTWKKLRYSLWRNVS